MSARILTQSHMAKAVSAAKGDQTDEGDILRPNQMKLYSYYRPGLLAENYYIEVTQHIETNTSSGKQVLDVLNTDANSKTIVKGQEFEVMVPHFSLDPNLINSYYPPDGHQDEGRILPHIVFNDPHFPWEIAPGVTKNLDGPINPTSFTADGKPVKPFRNMVPWIAMLVFDADELYIPTLAEVTSLQIPDFTTEEDMKHQRPNGSFTMKISQYLDLPKTSRINYAAGYENDETSPDYKELHDTQGNVDIIFPKKDLFDQIFADPGDDQPDHAVDGGPTNTPSAKSVPHKIRVEALKYLAHVRRINTVGFPDAGIEQEGLYSIVISGRTGPYKGTLPRSQVCHLVSIEHVDSTLGDWLLGGPDKKNPVVSDRVGMVSLHSWIYTALPPDPVNFITTMTHLTEEMQMLRINDKDLANLKKAIVGDPKDKRTAVAKVLHDRLANGYTLARWRTQTGEETVAFNRSPLVPQPVPDVPPGDLPDCSSTSQDYQFLDPETGLMDLSYSSAWQTGKLLAISDTVFSSALMRFRSVVHNSAAHKARMDLNNMKTRKALLASLQHTIPGVLGRAAGDVSNPQRIVPTSGRSVAPALDNPEVRPVMEDKIKAAIQHHTSAGDDLYNEFNKNGPNNSDWAIVMAWMCEKLSLGGIPPQCLIPEPSYLPPESLRFFYIDNFWLDCLLDGALSVANHLDADDDIVRREIKQVFNTYLSKPIEEIHRPQIPCYGFAVRSKVIKAMPDLRITVLWSTNDEEHEKHPVSRWTRFNEETLFCLLDRMPEELTSITLAQPLHQNRFSLGNHLDETDGLTFELQSLYTQNPPDGSWPPLKTPSQDLTKEWYNWDTRCLNLNIMAPKINDMLQFGPGTDPNNPNGSYNDPKQPNSVELALELADKAVYFEIHPPKAHPKPPDSGSQETEHFRQLYIQKRYQQPEGGGSTNAPADRARALSAFLPPQASSESGPIHQSLSKQRSSAPSPKPVPTPKVTPPSSSKAVSTSGLRAPGPSPPHSQTRIQAIPKPVPAVRAARATNPANPPLTPGPASSHYELLIYADTKPPPLYDRTGQHFHADDFLPTDDPFFYDLIFSVRKLSQSNQALLKITIDIPTFADPPPFRDPKPDQVEALLSTNYDGPGLRMISNQRFIPFLFHDDESGGQANGNMHIELIPRSTNDGFAMQINDRRTDEISFRLAEANVRPVFVSTAVTIDGQNTKQDRGLVTVQMTEWYATTAAPQGEPVAGPDCVVLKFGKEIA